MSGDVDADDAGLGVWDLLWLLLISAALVTLCVITSRQHPLWADELLGHAVLNRESLFQTMRGWWEGADGGGPVYYLLGHLWVVLFGSSDLAIRLFSTAGMIAALAITWTVARRMFPLLAVAPAAVVVFLYPEITVWQTENGRFYGLFLAVFALASAVFVRNVSHRRSTNRDLWYSFFASLLLIGSHILGLVYFAGLLAALLIVDALRRDFRWRLYLANLAGCIMLPLCFHAIRSSTSIAANVFWTTRPRLVDLIRGAFLYNLRLGALIILLGLCVAFVRRRRIESGSVMEVWTLWLGLLVAEMALFVKSRHGISIFTDRYLIPFAVGDLLLLAAILTPAARWIQVRKAAASLWQGTTVFLLLVLAFHASRHTAYKAIYASAGTKENMERMLPSGTPVVTTSMSWYLFLSHYDPERKTIFLVDPSFGRSLGESVDLSPEHLMENWKRAGFAGIQDCSDALSAQPNFILIVEPTHSAWLSSRVSSPTFQVEKIGESLDWHPVSLWRVHRMDAGAVVRCDS